LKPESHTYRESGYIGLFRNSIELPGIEPKSAQQSTYLLAAVAPEEQASYWLKPSCQ